MRIKKTHRLVSILLALVLIFTAFPMTTVRADQPELTLSLSKTKFNFNNKRRVPTVKVMADQDTLVTEDCYSISYRDSKGKSIEDPIKPGTYTVVVTFTKEYTGELTADYKIKTTSYTVSFDPNKGKGEMESMKCRTNKTYKLKASSFTRKGYKLKSFNTKANGTGKTIKLKGSFSNLSYSSNGKITLYAQWKKKPAKKSHRQTGDFSTSYKKGKYYDNLQKVKKGKTIQDTIVIVAQSQVGYHESNSSKDFSGECSGSSNYTEYGRWTGMTNGCGGWCAAFASWVIYMADVPGAKVCRVPAQASTDFGGTYHKWTSKSSAKDLRKGDIIACDWGGGSRTTHIEIVCNNPEVDGVVYTINGNAKDQVQKRSFDLLSQKSCSIQGYIRFE